MRFPSYVAVRSGFALLTLSTLAALAACAAPPPIPTTISSTPTVLVSFTPNPQQAELPTLLPTVVIPPTSAVGAVPTTPAVSTDIPSATPIQVTATAAVAVATRAPTTVAVPTETATPFPEGLPKVFVTSLRVEPATPKADVGGTFFVTFQNASGKDDGYNWAVEIWDTENDKRPYGLTTPQSSAMPVGTTNLTSTGWTVKGLGECHAYRARVVSRDQDDNRATFIQPDGTILWIDFSVCP